MNNSNFSTSRHSPSKHYDTTSRRLSVVQEHLKMLQQDYEWHTNGWLEESCLRPFAAIKTNKNYFYKQQSKIKGVYNEDTIYHMKVLSC